MVRNIWDNVGNFQPNHLEYLLPLATVSLTQFSVNTLQVTVRHLNDSNVGTLQAVVVVNGSMSPLVAVAEVAASQPSIVPTSISIAASATGNRIEIQGLRFASAGTLSVEFVPTLTVQSTTVFSDTLVLVDVASTTSIRYGLLSAKIINSLHGESALTNIGKITSRFGLQVPQVRTLLL